MTAGRPYTKRTPQSLQRRIEELSRLRTSLLIYEQSDPETMQVAVEAIDVLVGKLIILSRKPVSRNGATTAKAG